MILQFLFRARRATLFLLSRASRRRFAMSSFSFLFEFRISKISRRRNVIETKSDKSFIDRFVVEEKNDDEFIDENDNEISNCVKCCRVSMSCRRVIDIVYAKCFKQKQVCISICLQFAFFLKIFF
jgi:hypothetical protein